MKEIVDRILQEEELARKKIENADKEGKSMVSQAAEESRKILKDAINQADLSAQGKKEEAYKAFIAEKEKVLKQTREQIFGKIEARNKDIPAIAGRLFAKVIESDK
jgi:vacuolar-type H+-ATPase subunit H